jgi:hypothetical protein
MKQQVPPPPPPPPWNAQPGARVDVDIASQQRERFLRSAGSGKHNQNDTPNASNLDVIARRILNNKGLNTDPFPSPDQLIVLFLRHHDVDVRPPAGTKAGDAISGAFFGAVGPAASFAGSHLRQQEKLAAMQEWTSWKQWALGHADWPGFKERVRRDYDANTKAINDAVSSSWFHSEYQKFKLQKKKQIDESSKIGIIIAVAVLALGGFSLILSIGQRLEKPLPYSPEQSSPGFDNR